MVRPRRAEIVASRPPSLPGDWAAAPRNAGRTPGFAPGRREWGGRSFGFRLRCDEMQFCAIRRLCGGSDSSGELSTRIPLGHVHNSPLDGAAGLADAVATRCARPPTVPVLRHPLLPPPRRRLRSQQRKKRRIRRAGMCRAGGRGGPGGAGRAEALGREVRVGRRRWAGRCGVVGGSGPAGAGSADTKCWEVRSGRRRWAGRCGPGGRAGPGGAGWAEAVGRQVRGRRIRSVGRCGPGGGAELGGAGRADALAGKRGVVGGSGPAGARSAEAKCWEVRAGRRRWAGRCGPRGRVGLGAGGRADAVSRVGGHGGREVRAG
ncbi:hypothetical protein BKA15_000462 [Microlunatus parietis]|uniref:Uncharacterized protein n=1 Tax=Microlunatus parietis TaxID=682979 RepID=A0A7Y9L9W0_9ACTN|nr:hypothetical protein [Microlunatus parietis]